MPAAAGSEKLLSKKKKTLSFLRFEYSLWTMRSFSLCPLLKRWALTRSACFPLHLQCRETSQVASIIIATIICTSHDSSLALASCSPMPWNSCKHQIPKTCPKVIPATTLKLVCNELQTESFWIGCRAYTISTVSIQSLYAAKLCQDRLSYLQRARWNVWGSAFWRADAWPAACRRFDQSRAVLWPSTTCCRPCSQYQRTGTLCDLAEFCAWQWWPSAVSCSVIVILILINRSAINSMTDNMSRSIMPPIIFLHNFWRGLCSAGKFGPSRRLLRCTSWGRRQDFQELAFYLAMVRGFCLSRWRKYMSVSQCPQ